MNLYLLRHGLAVEPGTPGYARDADRPLTPRGERKVLKIGRALRALDLCFDVLLSSPYLRARQTAELVASALHTRKKLEFTDSLTPGGSVQKLVETLNHLAPTPEDVLLVGHEPYLSELLSLLVFGQSGASIVIKKGGLAKLAAHSLHAGQCAALEWLLTPKQMALIA